MRTTLIVLMFASSAAAQIPTATILGAVNDPTGLPVSGASVRVTAARTGSIRVTQTNETGRFTVPALLNGEYTLRVEAPGFQSFERRGIVITSQDYWNAGTIQLTIGSTTETVSVQAQATVVQSTSAEVSALLESKQLNTLLTRGRDVTSLLRLMPGVSQTGDQNALGAEIGSGTPSISGLRNNDNTISIDGGVSSDSDNVNVHISAINIDAIEEVKIVTNAYQAEYGRNAGAQVNIISRSGTREFHGSLSWFKRHEQFNANEFFNNLNALPKGRYRYNNWTGTIGGPVTIPGKFNTSRNKLFFFFTHDEWRAIQPQNIATTTMPTALERAGDFSRTFDLNGRLIPVFDPLTQTVFAGNIIPASRLHPLGRGMLNVLPEPNFLDTSVSRGNYNYRYQDVRSQPKRLEQAKVDWNVSDKDRMSFRWRKWRQDSFGYTAITGFGGSNWDLLYHNYAKTEDNGLFSYTKTITPALINELSFLARKIGEIGPPIQEHLPRVTRAGRNLTGFKQLFPTANPFDVIPAMSFGGVPSAPSVSYDNRFPIDAGDTRWSLADNLSYTRGRHFFKFGGYYEFNISDEGISANCFSGCLTFNADRNNLFDSNHAYANALLGVYRSYSESSRRNFRGGENWLWESFAQDSWKLTRRLTLEIGLRFSLFSPWMPREGQLGAAWSLGRYDTSKAVTLYRPARDARNSRVAQNPRTGEFGPAVLIGAIVPGAGDPFNGMVLAEEKGFPRGWQRRPPVQLGPRFGFAYDIFGNGRTAIRGGFGITVQTNINSGWANANINAVPPVVVQPTIFYNTLDNLATSPTNLFPAGGVRMFELEYKPAKVYNYSLGVQHSLGWETVVGITYVGNQGKHLPQTRDLNTLPYGARFLPQNQDPTQPGRPLPDTFFTPFIGYTGINLLENSGISNYNSLQVTANRRFQQGFQFGLAWTWSKAMNLSDGLSSVPMHLDRRVRLYGKAGFDQTHMLVVNYVWDLPRASKRWDNLFSRTALDNWQLAGFSTLASGQPQGIGFSTTDNADLTGGGDGIRANVLSSPILPKSERTFFQYFNPNVFGRPNLGEIGNAPKDVFRGPGINNWDLSLFKSFPLGSEKHILQFRSEFYNAFNHTQFSGVDAGARFDPQGRQVNARLGQIISARAARVIQFALAFRF
jgi:hypothetical protein